MAAPVDSPDIARAWTASLVQNILRPLRAETEERLYAIPWITRFPNPDLAAATVMISLAGRYAQGGRPDDLMTALRKNGADPSGSISSDDARALVLVARLMVHSALLPDPRWWEPMYHAQHLAIACVREATAAGMSVSEVAEMVGRRLAFPLDPAADILEAAMYEPGVQFSVDRETAGEMAERLDRCLGGGVAGEVLERALKAMPEAREERFDLAFAAAQLAQLKAAAERAGAEGDRELLDFIESEKKKFGRATKGLSLLELELIRSVGEDEQILFAGAALAKRVLTLSKEMTPTELPDLIDGRWELSRGMDLYLGLAGQSYQQRVGPIISWSVTFERLLPDNFKEGRAVKLGVGLVEESDTEFIVLTVYDGEDAESSIYYPPGSVTSTLALALLALTGWVRLDFYVLTRTRSIQHVSQGAIAFDEEDRAKISRRAVTRCRALMADGWQGAVRALEREHSREEAPVIGFLMNDSGKSEQLLDARLPGAALGPGRTVTPAQEAALAEARRGLIKAEAQRIENPCRSNEEAAAEEASSYIALVQRSRGEDPRGRASRSIEAVEELVEGIASNRRAVVHLTIDSLGLELVWADQATERTEVELITCDDVDLDRLAEALRDPEGGSVAALDHPDGPGVALGRRIKEQMDARGVDQLLICSTRHLHQLPIHALLMEPGGTQRLIDVAEVVYAPSSAIVKELAGTPPRSGPKVVAAAAADLEHAAGEAALIRHLAAADEVLLGKAATPAAILTALGRASWFHITSHGGYEARDYLASGLLVPTSENSEFVLTVARILADADVSGIDLAVLGACQSGAGQTEKGTLDVAGGLDTALLAAGVRNVVSALWEIDDLGALLFHGEFYRALAEGQALMEAYRQAVEFLRWGAWKRALELPLGVLLEELGIEIEASLAELEPGDDGLAPLDYGDLQEWAPFRICGIGALARELPDVATQKGPMLR